MIGKNLFFLSRILHGSRIDHMVDANESIVCLILIKFICLFSLFLQGKQVLEKKRGLYAIFN